MHMKNAYKSNGYWIDSRSAKKKCGEWLEVSNDNYGCLTYEDDWRKKMGAEQMANGEDNRS